jgi:hypothetical protein
MNLSYLQIEAAARAELAARYGWRGRLADLRDALDDGRAEILARVLGSADAYNRQLRAEPSNA